MEQVNATSALPASGGTVPPKPALGVGDRAAVAPGRPTDPRLWKAATDFQEVMLSQFTQAMRSTESNNDLFEQCPGRETFDQMFSDAIAHQMSASGAMGLNKSIYRAMGGTYAKGNAAAPLSAQVAPAPGLDRNRASATETPRALAGRVIPESAPHTAHDMKPLPASNGGAAVHTKTAE